MLAYKPLCNLRYVVKINLDVNCRRGGAVKLLKVGAGRYAAARVLLQHN